MSCNVAVCNIEQKFVHTLPVKQSQDAPVSLPDLVSPKLLTDAYLGVNCNKEETVKSTNIALVLAVK